MIITDLIRTNWLRSVLLKVRYSVLLALQTLTTIRPIRPHTRHIILTYQYLHLLSCYVPLGHAVYKCGENNDNPSNSPPGGGGYSHTLPIRACAARDSKLAPRCTKNFP